MARRKRSLSQFQACQSTRLGNIAFELIKAAKFMRNAREKLAENETRLTLMFKNIQHGPEFDDVYVAFRSPTLDPRPLYGHTAPFGISPSTLSLLFVRSLINRQAMFYFYFGQFLGIMMSRKELAWPQSDDVRHAGGNFLFLFFIAQNDSEKSDS